MEQRRGMLWFGAAATASLIVLAVGLASGPGTPTAQTYGDFAILMAVVTALASHIRAALLRRDNPVGRWFLVAGLFVWAAGMAIWTYYGVTLDHAYPFPSLADIGFTGYAVPVTVALLLLAKRDGPKVPVRRMLLDAGVVASAVLFIVWGSVLGPIAEDDYDNPLAHLTQLAYPIVDIVMMSLVIVLTMRAARGRRLQWLCLSLGFLFLALTDIIYMRLTYDGVTGVTGSPLAIGWVLAFLLVAFSPLIPETAGAAKDGRAYAAMLELLPYIPVFITPFFSRTRPLSLSDPVPVITGIVVLILLIVRQVMIVVENVTLTRQLESKVAARTAELEELAAIVNSSGDAIVGKTPEGVITTWNPGAERIYGYPAAEAIGRHSDFFIPKHLLDNEHAILDDAARDGKIHTYETERIRGDGSTVSVALTMSPIRGDEGIRGVATIAQDITQRKAAEAELRAAQETALESSRLKSEFLATMSHEIRTPLNAVIGLTSLLLETRLNDTQREYAKGVKSAGEVLLTLINDILDFSKLEAGKVDLEQAPFDPRLLVEEVAGLVAEAAQAKGLELISYCHPNVPARLVGDAGRIRQILLNLSSNAVKFTQSGEVEITVKSLRQDTEKAMLRFEVRDTGIGIGTTDHQRLFESFAQADASTTRKYGGTGLGLAISRRLTEAMGGQIGVTSELGQGSTFWFVLELPVGPAAKEEDEPVPDLLDGLKVLVVDDNATNRLVLESQLSSWGMRPEAAPDAQSALEKYHEALAAGAPYDLAVVDMCMPDTDGVELARQIQSEGEQTPRFILLTSTMQVDKEKLAEAGIREHLTKPVRSSEFYNRLLRLMAAKPPAPREPAHAEAPARPERTLGRLLVAEDNEVNQLVAQGMAARLGYDVDIVTDGAQAVAATAAVAYSAILMDCHMPVMDGFEATRAIRARGGQAGQTPIIAMTAGALDEDRERCIAAGMDDYVSKPVDMGKLGAVLARWVTARQVPADLASDKMREDGLPPSGPAVDAGRLAVLKELGPDDGYGLLPEAARAFREDAAQSIEALRQALDSRDPEALKYAAHKLAGASSNIGANGAAELCKELERLGQDAGKEVPLAQTGGQKGLHDGRDVDSRRESTEAEQGMEELAPGLAGLLRGQQVLAKLEAELARVEEAIQRALSESP